MSNTWIAVNNDNQTVAEFLSRDYDPLELVEQYGPVTIYDRTDTMRHIDTLHPDYIRRNNNHA